MLLALTGKIRLEIRRVLISLVFILEILVFNLLHQRFFILRLLRFHVWIWVEHVYEFRCSKSKRLLQSKFAGSSLYGTGFSKTFISLVFSLVFRSRWFRSRGLAERRAGIVLTYKFWVCVSRGKDSCSISWELNWIVVLIEELLFRNWLRVTIRKLLPLMSEAIIIVMVLLRIHLLGMNRNPRALVADMLCVEFLPS